MQDYRLPTLFTLLIFTLLTATAAGDAPEPRLSLVDLEPDSSVGEMLTAVQGAEPTFLPEKKSLYVKFLPVGPWPGASINPGKKGWDLTSYSDIEVKVRNVGTSTFEFCIRVDSPKPKGDKSKPNRLSVGGKISLRPGEEGTVTAPLRRRRDGAPVLVGMDRFPQGLVGDDNRVNPAQVNKIVLFVYKPIDICQVEVTAIDAVGTYTPQPWESMDEESFFPFIDKFGQFKHQTWPGKITTEDELVASWKAEEELLAAKPRHTGWNQYGGYEQGPQLEATGRFQTRKIDGKWWLVDPAGRVFFSHGISALGDGSGGSAAIDDRRHYFEWIPDQNGKWADCFSTQKRVNRGYYKGKQPLCFGALTANRIRKFGDDWQSRSIDLIHRRFRSWGLNTMGCWTRPEVWKTRTTPYCTWVFYSPKPIWGKIRGWKRFPDVFDPTFAPRFQAGAQQFLPMSKGDEWCIGVFSDNEMAWWDSATLVNCVLTAPPNQVAKQVCIDDLKAKYTTIDAFNEAWGEKQTSWEALLANRDLLTMETDAAAADALTFYEKMAHTYFKTTRDAIKAIDPDFLYLGVRFNGDFPEAARVAAEYCDVLSYNFYRDTVADFTPPAGVDRPCIIGEFHFGALDRGLFGAGLNPVKDQQARAAAYANYVMGAVRNPWFVGTHWFTYSDEPVAGRALDAENHQIGFVDVTDSPYPELLEAAKEVAVKLYPTRLQAN